jgi:small subunit ribosomal protein S18e
VSPHPIVLAGGLHATNTTPPRLPPAAGGMSARPVLGMTSINGIGRCFSNIVCKKADIDMNKRQVSCFGSEDIMLWLRGYYQISLATMWLTCCHVSTRVDELTIE